MNKTRAVETNTHVVPAESTCPPDLSRNACAKIDVARTAHRRTSMDGKQYGIGRNGSNGAPTGVVRSRAKP